MWAAAISSVIGAAYTSVSFIRTFSKKLDINYRWLVIAFIVFSTLVFVIVGRPVFILVLVGTLNGLILPITLGVMLLAAYNKKIVGDYKHPKWMTVFGVIVVIMTAYMSVMTLITQVPKWFS
jgi:Mn2+/Fe2+ NRAMP family transporter